MDSKYIEYFYALKSVWLLHTQYGFGTSPDIPSGYSEALCKHIYKLDKTETRENDARNSSGTVEIKATGTHEGKTTISNSNQFKTLYWMFFDFKSDSVIIYEMPREYFNLNGEKGRRSIRLLSIAKKNNIVPQEFKFLISTNK